MSRLCFFVVFCCFSNFALGQSGSDSLKLLLKASVDRNDQQSIANYSSQIAWMLLNQGQYDSAIFYANQSLETSQNDRKLTASNFNSIGIIYNNKGLPDSATFYYYKALSLYLAENDTANSTNIEINLAIIYKNRGLYEKALEHVFSALNKLERLPPDRPLASAYNTVGSVYSKMNDHADALVFYKKALKIRQQIAYQKGIGQSYNNIGETYIALKIYDSALINLQNSARIKRLQNDRNAMGATLNHIGSVLIKQKAYTEARINLIESVKIKHEFGERIEEAMALNNLGELSLAMNDPRLAENYLLQARSLLRQSQALDHLQRNLELMAQVFIDRGDSRRALETIQELLIVKDSLLSKEKMESLLAMHVRYETERKEQQIALLEQQRELHKIELASTRLWVLGLVLVVMLLVIIAALTYANFRTIRRNKMGIEILLRELHHRVKNNLQLLASIFSLQSRELRDERALQAIKTSEARINAMALIHRKLYNIDKYRTINIKAYIDELVQYLIFAYGYNEKPFKLSASISEVQVDVDKAIPLGLILNELISNSFKYAYNENLNPELIIDLKSVDEKICIDLSDNGKGIQPADLAEHDSFGLRMVNTLVTQLKGYMDTKTENGTHYKLVIPL